MADFCVYDRNGRLSGCHKTPESAVTQAKKLAMQTGDFADVEKRQGRRRRYFASGQVITLNSGRGRSGRWSGKRI